jgi:hypothetical protein
MRRSGKGSGGGYGSRPVSHRSAGKTEPRTHAKHVGGVSQFGEAIGTHRTSGTESSYRGDPIRAGRGYEPPGMISDPVKAVGVGGGRTIYKTGSQCQTGTNPGNPRPNPRREALEQE